uniref:Putative nuclease n=1 Tax=viral metagenome TaxID=1070528 RepID=A0A6M3LF50_9ZZZZ
MGDRVLTIDRREIQEHQDIPDLIELPFVVDTLIAADYAFLSHDGSPVGIERCEIGNLIGKLRSGELESQMAKCELAYSSIILLVEGVYDKVQGFLSVHGESGRGYFRKHIYPHTRYDYAIAEQVNLSGMGIELIHSPNFPCSMVVVRTIYNQRTKPEEERSLFRKIRPIRIPVKLSANPAVPMLMSLCPRLSEKTAIRLINQYDSIWNILNVSDDDLLQTEGFGKTLIRRLKEGVGKV